MLSRVADSLYWMSRYVERAENNARILDVNLQLMLDFENQSESLVRRHWEPIINTLEERELFFSLYTVADADSVIDFIAFEKKNPNSIVSSLAHARENARTVREQISSEMWEELNRLYLFMISEAAQEEYRSSAKDFFDHVVFGSHMFQGITNATMTHGEGWHFIQAGKLLERADSTSRILDVKYHILLPSGEQVGGNLDTIQWMAVLKSCSSFEAYTKIYRGRIVPWQVAEFLVLSDLFPRSIRFCIDALDRALHEISGCPRSHFTNEAERLSGKLCSDLDYSSTKDIFDTGLHQYLDNIQLRLIKIDRALFEKFFEWMEDSEGKLLGRGEMSQSQG